jgi:hypothetical protein
VFEADQFEIASRHNAVMEMRPNGLDGQVYEAEVVDTKTPSELCGAVQGSIGQADLPGKPPELWIRRNMTTRAWTGSYTSVATKNIPVTTAGCRLPHPLPFL